MSSSIQQTSLSICNTPLESNPFKEEAPDDILFRAFNRCVTLQNSTSDGTLDGQQKHALYARYLAYLILEAPTREGAMFISRGVTLCKDNDQLLALSEMLLAYLGGVFEKQRSRSNVRFHHPVESTNRLYKEQGSGKFITIFKVDKLTHLQALERDGGVCMVTRLVDRTFANSGSRTQRESIYDHANSTTTNLCHIFPRSLSANLVDSTHEGRKNLKYSAVAWALIRHYSGIDVFDGNIGLNGDLIHELRNVMTLGVVAHHAFDSLDLWLEQTEDIRGSDAYHVKTINWIGARPFVTFVKAKDHDLPHWKYLQLHASLSRAFQRSGIELLSTTLKLNGQKLYSKNILDRRSTMTPSSNSTHVKTFYTPLPKNLYLPDGDQRLEWQAYRRCLDFEESAKQEMSVLDQEKRRVDARTLGYLIMFAPTDLGRRFISEEVNACNNNKELVQLAKFLQVHLVKIFYKHRITISYAKICKLHHLQDLETRYADELNRIETILSSSTEPKDTDSLREQAMKRDGGICMLTGAYDGARARRSSFATREDIVGAKIPSTSCQLSHIFPISLMKGIKNSTSRKKKTKKSKGKKAKDTRNENKDTKAKRTVVAKALLLVEKYSQINLIKEGLIGDGINQLSNVMLLCQNVHDSFDDMESWLEPDIDAGPNSYRVFTVRPIADFPENVTFVAGDGLQLPISQYLELHGCLARVFQMSGLGIYKTIEEGHYTEESQVNVNLIERLDDLSLEDDGEQGPEDSE
ncbi:hypothetical protein CVT24_010347 [Panaeolus cyanescens]|uniref:HNH nuclease domain-containing protein n=1 Tax=Panaeolus cyanescens TaxID=181874 RepID=A0A409YQE6_9AGAR|nr:hypothetical protein CVT24_010347 [Panaeolus cyanescens]